MTKRTAALLLTLTVLIVFGFLHAFNRDFFAVADNFEEWAELMLAWLAPLMPLALVLVRIGLRKPLRPEWPAFTATLVFLGGLYAAYYAGGLSGPGAYLVLVQGSLLALAIASAILVLAFGRLETIGVWIAKAGLFIAALGAVWSLAAIPAALTQAERLAGSGNYCITKSDSYDAVRSIWGLRGFTFYSASWGYGNGKHFYSHGTLVVADPTSDRIRLYRWTPAHLGFDLQHSGTNANLIVYALNHANPQGCQPPYRLW